MPRMSEVGWTVAAIRIHPDEVPFRLYSKYVDHESSEFGESYSHGLFADMEEALYSIEQRCEEAGIEYTRPYARNTLAIHTF